MMSDFLASVGACNVILHIHVVISWQLSKQVFTDQYHMTVSLAQVLTHRGYVFLKVIP